MATAKPKVKRMMFGGAAKAAPVRTQSQMQAAAKSAAPNQMQFMSDKLRGAPMQSVAKQAPAQLASLAKAYNAQKSGNMGTGSQAAKTGLGQAAQKQFMSDKLRGIGAAATGAGRALGMGKKKGGAVKKATKK